MSSIETFIKTFYPDDLNGKKSLIAEVIRRIGVLEDGLKNGFKESGELRNFMYNQKHRKQEIQSIILIQILFLKPNLMK